MSVDVLLASFDSTGRDFERLCKWMLENAPEYRSKVKRVWLWDEWPGRGGRDIGIDLVAEDREGGMWAVQAKHYDPAYSIKKKDIDSFLSASSRAEFTYRLLIATTDHMGSNARSVLAIQEKPVGTLLRSQLDTLEVAWPSSITRLLPARPRRKRPRPHQRRAIRDCAQGLAAAERGQLVMACGTGKTLVGPFLAEQMGAKRVLVLVPSLSLLGQTLREWATATEFDYLAVCSDDTVTKDEADAVVASTSELAIPVTTDPDRIARFLRRRGNETKVVFSTYQSSPQIAAAQADRVPSFDLVIADEAHRCAGPQVGVFATVLDGAKIKAHKRLFMTATPRYFTGRVKREASEAEWEVASMDEEAKFGPVLHRLTFGRAIEQELLSDYCVVVVGVTDAEALDLAARGAFVTHDGQAVTDARTLARQIGLLRAMAKYDLQRIVTFHSRIEYATRFASSLPGTNAWLPVRRRPSGDLWADHVSGKMTAGERDARLRRLSGVGFRQRGVLTNARCLTEGVDVPTLDGVAFIDPRRSQVDVVQAVGRAIRKANDKALGYIIVPVLVDEERDAVDALESSEFDRVWQIVQALRDHDDDLAEELDSLRFGKGRHGSIGERPGKIVLDLPVGIGEEFARAFDASVVERSTSWWTEGIGAAEGYYAQHGHLRVAQRFRTSAGFPLGQWLSNCRVRRERLSLQEVAQLEAVGMVWDMREENWHLGLAKAREFRREHGHLRVPQRLVTDDGFPLGQWMSNRRSPRGKAILSPKRVAELDALGMAWDYSADVWSRGLAASRIFHESNGHLLVPDRYITDDEFPLGSWVSIQRTERRRGKLTDDEIADLDDLGMIWDVNQWRWETALAEARAYSAAYGHLRIPMNHVTDTGLWLGRWLNRVRADGRAGRLPDERVAALDELGIVWDSGRGGSRRRITATSPNARTENETRSMELEWQVKPLLINWRRHERVNARIARAPDGSWYVVWRPVGGWALGRSADLNEPVAIKADFGSLVQIEDAQLIASAWAVGIGDRGVRRHWGRNLSDAENGSVVWECRTCKVGGIKRDYGQAEAAARGHWRRELRAAIDSASR